MKLNPDERLLIENGVNHYKLIGPGRVWLLPWQKVLTKLNVGPQGQPLYFENVRSGENVPVNVTLQLLYQVDPQLFTAEMLPKLPSWQAGSWQAILKWRTEYVLRRVMADLNWRDLAQEATQQRLERRLTQTLATFLKLVGLNLMAACVIKTELPADLQHTIIQAERDGLEPRGRALVLKEYFDLFGHDLGRAMPHIVQWELLNLLRQNGQTNLILTGTGLTLDQNSAGHESVLPLYQMQLPQLPQK